MSTLKIEKAKLKKNIRSFLFSKLINKGIEIVKINKFG